MEWSAYIDAYCERTDPGYWSEPVNAMTNAAFLIAAAVMWRRTRGLPLGRLLCAILVAIGVGSYLFHTHATAWASTADTTPIGFFILTYVYAANRTFWGWPVWLSALGAAGFIPWAMVLTPIFSALPFFAISSFYWPVPLLIALYALLLRRPRARDGDGAGDRRRDPGPLAVLPLARRAALRRDPRRHAFPVAHPERPDARLDDRGLAPSRA